MFPVSDWQFWVATLIALAAACFLLRTPIASIHRLIRRKPKPPKQTRVSLTVEGDKAKRR